MNAKNNTYALFSTGILHNINNYLLVISAYADLGMLSSSICNIQEYFKNIHSTVDNCTKAVNQMTASMKSFRNDSKAIDLGSVIPVVIDMFKPLADNIAQISFACDSHAYVYADDSDVSQIILNLLFNTRDAIESDGEIDIWIYQASKSRRTNSPDLDEYICVSVKDNGPGIPEKILKGLFGDVKSTKIENQHAGIGLVISQMLAEKHGGWIECAQTGETGTEFVIYLRKYNQVISGINN